MVLLERPDEVIRGRVGQVARRSALLVGSKQKVAIRRVVWPRRSSQAVESERQPPSDKRPVKARNRRAVVA